MIARDGVIRKKGDRRRRLGLARQRVAHRAATAGAGLVTPRTARIRRRVTAAFTERLGYKAVAVFLAIALWLYTHIAGPPSTP